MRSIFDQYDAPENRLTHALGCCLDRDRRLLRAFIRWTAGKGRLPRGRLALFEQQVPDTPLAAREDDESGLPDLWVHDHQRRWSLIVESKVRAKVSEDQLLRHRRTARANDFTDVTLLVIAPTIPARRMGGVVHRTWPQVYVWMRRQTRSEWAACMAEYMEVAEARMMAEDYLGDEPLTEFHGIPFGPGHPYTYREAKRVLKLAMGELRKRPDLRKLGMDLLRLTSSTGVPSGHGSERPNLRRLRRDPFGPGRPAITGQGGSAVWDLLPLGAIAGNGAFTSCPHLTLGIQANRTIVIVTLPNAVPARMRRKLTSLGVEGLAALVGKVEKGVSRAIRPVGKAYPFLECVQRHYPSQKSPAVVDARIEFDLRTAVGSDVAAVKRQPQWLEAIFQVLSAKRSNLQIGIGAALPYGDKRMQSREVLDVIAGVWVGCKFWLDALLNQDGG